MTLEEEANKYAEDNICYTDQFIAGANSKWVQAEKIKAQIEVLENLSARLKEKKKTLLEMIDSEKGSMRGSMLSMKKSGVGLAIEDIRIDILNLNEQLKQLEDESR
jgi:hypothetical protein